MIFDWLVTPEAQIDPHYWASVALAHLALGGALALIVAAMLSLIPRRIIRDRALSAVQIVAIGYAGWEVAQMWVSGTRDYTDAVIDWSFTTGGAAVSWAIWSYRKRAIAAILTALSVLLLGGIGRRR